MEIEILTTKKKISKSLINQMRVATFNLDVLNNGEILGFLNNVTKDSEKVVLIKRLSDYYIVKDGWHNPSGSRSTYKQLPRYFTTTKDFDSKELAEIWWEAYIKCFSMAKNQIYI
jgi:hypothetical protein